jgi:hypothetical protein
MNMNSKLALLSGCLFASVVGCSSGNANIGDGMPTASLGANLADYKGSWDGYVEAAMFADGSDRVRVELDENGVGTVRVGDSPEQPAPTDPNAPYPADVGDTIDVVTLRPEFRYSVNALVETRRLRFAADSFPPYAAYCNLFSPIPDPVNSTPTVAAYTCSNGTSSWGARNCRGACTCTAAGCAVYDQVNDSLFDAALSADGTQLFGVFDGENVVMTR